MLQEQKLSVVLKLEENQNTATMATGEQES